MSGVLETLIDPKTGRLHLTRERTHAWPSIQSLFAVNGEFPNGLVISPNSPIKPSDLVVSGRALIDRGDVAVKAIFTESGEGLELELVVSVELGSLTAAGSALGLKAAWDPTITFRSDARGQPPSISIAHATFHIGSLELTAELKLPSWRIEATLSQGKASLSTIMKAYAIDGGAPDLSVKELRLQANPWRGVYSVALTTGDDEEWTVGAFKLTKIAAHVMYSSQAATAWGAVMANVTFGGIPFDIEASYDGNVSGWQFTGAVASSLRLGDFFEGLQQEFGKKCVCPPALADAKLEVLSVSFNSNAKVFSFVCEAQLPIHGEKTLELALLVDIEAGHARFEGLVKLGSLEFDLVFDLDQQGGVLVASYTDSDPVKVKLGDLVAMVSSDAHHAQLDALEFSIKDALFVCERKGAKTEWLLAVDVEAGVDFSGLPLIGASFPPGQGARLLLQPLLTSGGIDLAALAGLVREGGLTLPDKLPNTLLSVSTRLSLGAKEIRLGLPVGMHGGVIAHEDPVAPQTELPEIAKVDNVDWVAVQKSFGPLALERVGVRYTKGNIALLLDAHLTAAGLTLALEGFGASVDLANPGVVKTTLDGMGIDFRSPTLDIGGSLLHQQIAEKIDGKDVLVDEYVGTAVVRAGTFSIDAIGSYRVVDGHPSLFVYAALDYPIGGPSFFFVTGLAAAFGYNRSFKLPPIDRLASFPLLSADAGKREATDLRKQSDALRPHIPAEVGAIFLGVGLRFTSFQTVSSSALLTASFGKEVSFDLIGRSTLLMPAGAAREQAVAFIEMAWMASYRPAEGLLALQAQVSPESYIFSKNCHLTGGFAFYSWFTGDRAGDFVLTVGGYHPKFDLAAHPHYPRVPRLGVSWRVDDALSIKGDAYYALTSSSAMAGGHLDLVWESFPYKAWCKAGIDCLFDWKPLHYTGSAYVELGASYTFQLGGTRHISVEVGADLDVWGPPFSGQARVHMVLFSFDVNFGSTRAASAPVHLRHDPRKVKVKGEEKGQEQEQEQGEGFMALLPPMDTLCAVSVADGLAGSTGQGKEKVWAVNAKDLRLVIDSAIPVGRLDLGRIAAEESDAGKAELARFGIAPMAAAHDAVVSTMTVTVTSRRDPKWLPVELQYRPRLKGFPSALWGEPGSGGPSGKLAQSKLVNACAGVEIITRPSADHRSNPGPVRTFKHHLPPLPNGIYDVKISQRLTAKPHEGPHDDKCCEPLEATASLSFEVGGGSSVLPPSSIHSVFPPRGSVGDYANALPQVILDRSTLPWERVLLGESPDTPWLALMLFDGEKKAVVKASQEGLPGRATIEIEENALPSPEQRRLLCHVRVVDEHQANGRSRAIERAVVLASRTPASGVSGAKPAAPVLSTAHLVSMDGMVTDGTKRHLFTLASWTFSSVHEGASFEVTMEHVSKESISASGVLLAHGLDDGQRGLAVYRGPLMAWSRSIKAAPPEIDVQAPPTDISRSAARELGRLLALQDKVVSVGLLRLKRRLSQQARLAGQAGDAGHLYPRSLSPAGIEPLLTPELSVWFKGLMKLEGVPFRYLLPDELLLPKESMRYFEVDRNWVTDLVTGALGVGGQWHLELDDAPPVRSGILLRSDVVPGWPAAIVHGILPGRKEKEVAPCRVAHLSKNILMVLFDGRIEHVVFKLPEETLHFKSKDVPLAKDWLRGATSSIDLGPAVGMTTQEPVRYPLV